MRRSRRRSVTGWHSNQKTYTEEFVSEGKDGRGVRNVMGTALTINVIALYLFV
jgi:hypothetical protein